jgi:O-antigen ligase
MAALAAGAVASLAAVAALAAGPPWVHALLTRATSLADPTQGSGATRLHIWADTLRVVAGRPWVGWGPDTFGLVFPRFQTGDWTPGSMIDKAHSDVLQVAATQGLVGVAAYLAIAAAFVVAFWRGRRGPGALAMLGAWLAYEVPLQLDFSWLPSAAPAWLLMGAAVAVWRRPPRQAVREAASASSPGRPAYPGWDGRPARYHASVSGSASSRALGWKPSSRMRERS